MSHTDEEEEEFIEEEEDQEEEESTERKEEGKKFIYLHSFIHSSIHSFSQSFNNMKSCVQRAVLDSWDDANMWLGPNMCFIPFEDIALFPLSLEKKKKKLIIIKSSHFISK